MQPSGAAVSARADRDGPHGAAGGRDPGLAPATLGTFSASKETTFSPGYWTRFGTFDRTSPITFFFIAAAQTRERGNVCLRTGLETISLSSGS